MKSSSMGAAIAARLLALALAFCWLSVLAGTASAAVSIQDVTSKKGIHAWLVEDYSVPIITIRFAFGGGTAQDPDGKEGLAYLMSGLFDEGAGDLDSEAFQEKLDDAGAEMNFDADRDRMYGSMRMLASEKDAAFGLLRLAVEKPRFDQKPIDRIRAQIVSGIRASENDPNTQAGIAMARALYGSHPYSKRTQGTAETLATITSDDLKAFHHRVFARDDLNVAVVGAIDAETLRTVLDQVFGGLPEKAGLTPVPDIQPKLDQRVQITYGLPQTSLQLVYPGVKRNDPNFFAAYLMNQILGGGTFSSRLFEEVREKRGLAYGATSNLIDREHADGLVIQTATRSDKAAETLAIVRDVVRKMADEGPTADELAEAKKYVVGAFAISNLDSSTAIARTLIDMQTDDLGIDYIQTREGKIDAVTLDGVKAAARKLLSAQPAVLIVGPKLGDGPK
ncbi:MAG: M16 family metallopeptidase [Rhizobiaceae bacterium]